MIAETHVYGELTTGDTKLAFASAALERLVLRTSSFAKASEDEEP